MEAVRHVTATSFEDQEFVTLIQNRIAAATKRTKDRPAHMGKFVALVTGNDQTMTLPFHIAATLMFATALPPVKTVLQFADPNDAYNCLKGIEEFRVHCIVAVDLSSAIVGAVAKRDLTVPIIDAAVVTALLELPYMSGAPAICDALLRHVFWEK